MWNLHLYKNNKFITECSCSNHAKGLKIVELLSEEYDKIEVYTKSINSYYLFTYYKNENEVPAFSYCSEDFQEEIRTNTHFSSDCHYVF